MEKRKGISKKLRFEVFKRDGFTCQYCGRMAPDVVLQVDHINPVKNGGDNNILNLITSCADCNNGKGAKLLTDKQELQKQQDQLKALSEKKEQLEFLVEWRAELLCANEMEVDVVEAEIHRFDDRYTLSDHGRNKVKSLIKSFSLNSVLEAVTIAYPRYNAKKTENSWEDAFSKIGGICRNKQREAEDPTFAFRNKAYYIFKNNLPIYNEGLIRGAIREHVYDEASLEEFSALVCSSRSWTSFFDSLEERG